MDAVIGLRDKAHLSKKVFVTSKAGLGGGPKFTYQLFGGVGYEFGRRYALISGSRDLSANYDKNNFLFDISLHWSIVGFGIKF